MSLRSSKTPLSGVKRSRPAFFVDRRSSQVLGSKKTGRAWVAQCLAPLDLESGLWAPLSRIGLDFSTFLRRDHNRAVELNRRERLGVNFLERHHRIYQG